MKERGELKLISKKNSEFKRNAFMSYVFLEIKTVIFGERKMLNEYY